MELQIPCVMMRGGTSRGPYFRAEDLPAEPGQRDRILLQVMGSPHALQINGLGGGNSLTSKVAIVSRSQRPGCDVDYLFAQVAIDRATVDTRPNCGNLLSGVGPYAIEEGLVPVHDGITPVRIFNVNTNTLVEAAVPTPHGRVSYDGDTHIDGVPGTGAPIILNFLDVQGGVTGSLFPTGSRSDLINGVDATCIDAAMPVVIIAAASLGLRGDETPESLDADAPLLARLEAIRREAGRRMGLGDVSDSVIPKLIVASPAGAGAVQSRYFTPHRCHKAHAVTGAIAVASSFAIAGTVTHAMSDKHEDDSRVVVRHPAGAIEIALDIVAATPVAESAAAESSAANMQEVRIARAGVVRTARRIMKGTVYVSDDSAAAGSEDPPAATGCEHQPTAHDSEHYAAAIGHQQSVAA